VSLRPAWYIERVPGQPGPHREILSEKKKPKTKNQNKRKGRGRDQVLWKMDEAGLCHPCSSSVWVLGRKLPLLANLSLSYTWGLVFLGPSVPLNL